MINDNIRTDLAIESPALSSETLPGIMQSTQTEEGMKITTVKIQNHEGSKALSKPIGDYITFELDSIQGFTDNLEGEVSAFSKRLKDMLPPKGLVLVAGLGNSDITPDAVGPYTVDGILATRHFAGTKSTGLENLRPVSAIAPGVLGQTGIETAEIFHGVCEKIHPAAVIAVDALAARNLDRLGTTVQMSNTGISPGSGVQNSRKELSENTLGLPVIAIGIPTVVDLNTIAYDLTQQQPSEEKKTQGMMVTPREIDRMISKAAKFLSLGINAALQPDLNLEDILSLTDL